VDIHRCKALTGPEYNLDQVDIVLLSKADTLLGEHVYVGSQDLMVSGEYMHKICEFLAHRVCKSPVCNQGIRRDALSDEHKGIRHPQNSIRISRTTNTLAYASDCIHEETRRHRLSCTSHAANVCRLSQGVLFREDGSVAA